MNRTGNTPTSNALLLPWLVLSIATLVSWWLDATVDGPWVGTAILLVAFFKARVVLLHFMQVRAAPAAVRWCCEAWVLVACSSLIGTYWLAPFFY